MMKWPKLRELREAVRAVITGPYTSRFPVEPHTPHPNFRGQPKFQPEHCVGCLACEQVCPADAIVHQDILEGPGAPKRILFHYTDTCIFCGQCEAACIAEPKGIKLSNEWELSFFDRKTESYETIEKKLQLCERCGAVFGCPDHLAWVADHIGELAFGSPTLYLSQLESLAPNGNGQGTPHCDGWRPDRFKILCAKCRRETTLTTA